MLSTFCAPDSSALATRRHRPRANTFIDKVIFTGITEIQRSRRERWRECMGIEPTQPDVVRSRTVLKTVRATRLHPLPAASRKHETVMLLRGNLTDLDAFGNERKIVGDPCRWHRDEQAARRLGIDE